MVMGNTAIWLYQHWRISSVIIGKRRRKYPCEIIPVLKMTIYTLMLLCYDRPMGFFLIGVK